MNQVLIVDDEQNISKGIKHLFNYSAIDVDNIFIALSGYEALDILRTHEITLMITDIKMEGMDGLELMHEANLLYPWIQVIIISAFEEFEYAQKAIQLGAKDYLIKPLDSNHLINSIRNCLLNKTKKPTENYSALSGNEEMHIDIFDKESSGKKKGSEWVTEVLKEKRIKLDKEYYVSIQLTLANKKEIKSKYKEELITLIRQTVNSKCCIHIIIEEPFYIIIGWDNFRMIHPAYTEIEYIGMLTRQWQHSMENKYPVKLLVGYSQVLKGESSISELIRQTNEVLKLHQQGSMIHTYYYGDYNWSLFKKSSSQSNFRSQESLLIKKVKNYIKNHYTQRGLSLNQIAEANHISSNYLSNLFKQETGKNVWDYVIKLRMEESRYLWLNTDMKVYEISDHIGYESADHFSRVFKKSFGESPSKMKKRIAETN